MLYDSYEQVITRDRPAYWWRVNTPNTAGVGSFGNPGTGIAMTSPGTGVRGGPSIPGSTGGSTDTIGNSNVNNAHGWNSGAQAPPGLPSTSGWTYECWLQPTATPTAGRLYQLFSRNSTFYSSSVGFYAVDNNLYFNLDISFAHIFVAPSALVVGSWTHCVGIARDGNNQLWVNGKRVNQSAAGTPETTNPTSANPATFTFVAGRSRLPNSSSYSFPGFIAEPAFYGYVLSPSQIEDHYRAGITPRRRTGWTPLSAMSTASAPPEPQPAFVGATSLPTDAGYGQVVRRHQPALWWRGNDLADWGRR